MRKYWKKQVRIILPNGKIYHDTKEYGLELLRSGRAEAVEHPRFTVRLIDTSDYKEELRYVSGRPLKAVHNPTRPGTFLPGGTRCRPPRQQLDEEEREFREYKRTYIKKCA